MEQIKQNTKLLPIAKVNDREFLIDLDNREFRDLDDLENIVKMHSLAGRQILAGMKEHSETAWILVSERKRELEI